MGRVGNVARTCNKGKRVKIPLLPNNVGKKIVTDAGPRQGYHMHLNPHPHYITNFKYNFCRVFHCKFADADAHFLLGEFARMDATAEFRKVW